MDADDEDFLVVGAVEDGDAAAGREVAAGAPHEVVEAFLGIGRLEGGDVDALRVDAGHDVLDGAVLAGGIEGLEDDEDFSLMRSMNNTKSKMGRARSWSPKRRVDPKTISVAVVTVDVKYKIKPKV